MKALHALIAMLICAAPAAAETGVDAMPFLKLDAGPRPAAMGGAYCAAGEDAVSVFYNPASVALAGRSEIYLGHNEWLEGMRAETAALVIPHGARFTFFGSLNALMSGAMDKYDSGGTLTGAFDSAEYALAGGAAYALGAGFSAGAAVKMLRQSVDGRSASSFAGDAGLRVRRGNWSAGVSLSNFGGSLALGSESFGLPTILRAGAAMRVTEQLLVSAEGIDSGESGFEGAAGAELALPTGTGQTFFLRAGFRSGRDENAGPGLSAGAGMRTGPLGLDYSFSPYGDIGDSHRLSLSFMFGGERPVGGKKPYAPARAVRPYRRDVPRDGAEPAARPAPKKERQDEIFLLW